jgi:hypothetical protein
MYTLEPFLRYSPGDLTEAAEHGDVVPLGAFLVFTGLLVFPVLARRHANVRHRHARRHGAGFRVCAQIANQNDFVDSPRHGECPSSKVVVGPDCTAARAQYQHPNLARLTLYKS